MIKVISPTRNNLTVEVFNRLTKNPKSPINLILEADDEQNLKMTLSLDTFNKGCLCEQLQQASKNRQRETTIRAPGILMHMLNANQGRIHFEKFICYICTGRLQFKAADLQIYFLLGGVFKVRPFFHALIQQNVAMPLENVNTIKTLLTCSFDFFNDCLTEDGPNNFVWYLFRKMARTHNVLDFASNHFRGNMQVLEPLLVEYISFKCHTSELSHNDIDKVLDAYINNGYSEANAKKTVKQMVKWSQVPVYILANNKRNLEFSDHEYKELLKQRLMGIDPGNDNGNVDEELVQLRKQKVALKKQYQHALMTQGVLRMKIALKGCGILDDSKQGYQGSDDVRDYNQQAGGGMSEYSSKANLNLQFSSQSSGSYAPVFNPPNPRPAQKLNAYRNQKGLEGLDDQIELQNSLDKFIDTRAKPPTSSRVKKQEQPPFKFNIQHKEVGCPSNKILKLSCGCDACYQCVSAYYIQKSQLYELLGQDNLVIPKSNFQKYGVRCYICEKALAEIDVTKFNEMA